MMKVFSCHTRRLLTYLSTCLFINLSVWKRDSYLVSVDTTPPCVRPEQYANDRLRMWIGHTVNSESVSLSACVLTNSTNTLSLQKEMIKMYYVKHDINNRLKMFMNTTIILSKKKTILLNLSVLVHGY